MTSIRDAKIWARLKVSKNDTEVWTFDPLCIEEMYGLEWPTLKVLQVRFSFNIGTLELYLFVVKHGVLVIESEQGGVEFSSSLNVMPRYTCKLFKPFDVNRDNKITFRIKLDEPFPGRYFEMNTYAEGLLIPRDENEDEQ